MKLEGKSVFITGGTQGFGRAVAESVLKKGGKVCMADVKAEQGEKAATELGGVYGQDNVMFARCDVTIPSELEGAFKSAVSTFGYIDVVCNNAGIMDERIWEKQIDINFTAVVRGTNLAVEHMRKDKGGRGGVIVNTASMAGILPTYWFPVYAGTKSAVHHFTTSFAQNPELKASEIRFVSICPSGAKTALLDLSQDQIVNLDHFKEVMEKAEYCTVAQVVEAFMKAMEDDNQNGTLLTITAKDGVTNKKLQMVDAAL